MTDEETSSDEDISICQDDSDVEEVHAVKINRVERVQTRMQTSLASAKTISLDESIAFSLSQLDEFQPMLVTDDIYINPGQETSMGLPDKDETMENYAKKSMLNDSQASFDSGFEVSILNSEETTKADSESSFTNKKRFLTTKHSFNLKRKSSNIKKTAKKSKTISKPNNSQKFNCTEVNEEDIIILDDEHDDNDGARQVRAEDELSKAPVENDLPTVKTNTLKRRIEEEDIENVTSKIARVTVNNKSQVEDFNCYNVVKTISKSVPKNVKILDISIAPSTNLANKSSKFVDEDIVIDDSDEENDQSSIKEMAKVILLISQYLLSDTHKCHDANLSQNPPPPSAHT